MLGGVTSHKTGALRLRKTATGVRVEGDVPELHGFPIRFLTRELNKSVRLTITIPADPPLVYEIVNLAVTGEGGSATELIGHLVAVDNKPPPKRRWWQRRKK